MHFSEIVLFAVPSLLWSVPLIRLERAARERNRNCLAWLVLSIFLMPTGWLSALSRTLVLPGMGISSFIVPFALRFVVLRLPPGPERAPLAPRAKWAHAALAAGYGLWMAVSVFTYTMDIIAPKAAEGAVFANLGAIRSAVSIYHGDAGSYPRDLRELVPRYLDRLPKAGPVVRGHRIVHDRSNGLKNFKAIEPDDAGGWGYVNDPSSSHFGAVFMNCTHESLSGPHPLKRLYEH